MATATEQYHLLLNAIKTTQELRASVAHVFEDFSDGIKKAEGSIEPEKAFISTMQKALLTVNNDLRCANVFFLNIAQLENCRLFCLFIIGAALSYCLFQCPKLGKFLTGHSQTLYQNLVNCDWLQCIFEDC